MNDALILSTSDSFVTDVVGSPTPVVVAFSATWCGPCQRLKPVLAELSARYRGRIAAAVVDVEEAPDVAQAYRVASMPTVLAFRQGKVVAQLVGFGSRRPLEQLFESLAAPVSHAALVTG